MYQKLISKITDRWNARCKRRRLLRLRSVLTQMGYDLTPLSDEQLDRMLLRCIRLELRIMSDRAQFEMMLANVGRQAMLAGAALRSGITQAMHAVREQTKKMDELAKAKKLKPIQQNGGDYQNRMDEPKDAGR